MEALKSCEFLHFVQGISLNLYGFKLFDLCEPKNALPFSHKMIWLYFYFKSFSS